MEQENIHLLLLKHFDEEELKTLCFRLEVNYADLPAKGRENKARELVGYLARRGRLPELLAAARLLRPHAPWPEESVGKEVGIPASEPADEPQPPTAAPTIKAGKIEADNIVQGVQQIGGQSADWPVTQTPGGSIEADDIKAGNVVQGVQYQAGAGDSPPPEAVLTAVIAQLDSLSTAMETVDLANLRQSLKEALVGLQEDSPRRPLIHRKLDYAIGILQPQAAAPPVQAVLVQLTAVRREFDA